MANNKSSWVCDECGLYNACYRSQCQACFTKKKPSQPILELHSSEESKITTQHTKKKNVKHTQTHNKITKGFIFDGRHWMLIEGSDHNTFKHYHICVYDKPVKKPKQPEDMPKRPQSSYFIFSNERRFQLKEVYPNAKITELSTLIATEWKSKPFEQRREYEDKSRPYKQKYDQNIAEYMKTEQYEEYRQKVADWRFKRRIFNNAMDCDDDHHDGNPIRISLPRKPRHEHCPRRPLTSYLLYARAVREQIKNEHPDSQITDVAKLISAKWKTLSTSQKEPYVSEAHRLKAQYKRDIEIYKRSEHRTAFKRRLEEWKVECSKRRQFAIGERRQINTKSKFVINNGPMKSLFLSNSITVCNELSQYISTLNKIKSNQLQFIPFTIVFVEGMIGTQNVKMEPMWLSFGDLDRIYYCKALKTANETSYHHLKRKLAWDILIDKWVECLLTNQIDRMSFYEPTIGKKIENRYRFVYEINNDNEMILNDRYYQQIINTVQNKKLEEYVMGNIKNVSHLPRIWEAEFGIDNRLESWRLIFVTGFVHIELRDDDLFVLNELHTFLNEHWNLPLEVCNIIRLYVPAEP